MTTGRINQVTILHVPKPRARPTTQPPPSHAHVSEHTHTQERKPRSQYTHNSEMLPNSSLPPEARTAPKGDNNKIISLQEPTPSSEKREPVRVSDPLDRLKKRPEAYERDKIEPWDGSFFSSFKKAKRSNRSKTPLRERAAPSNQSSPIVFSSERSRIHHCRSDTPPIIKRL